MGHTVTLEKIEELIQGYVVNLRTDDEKIDAINKLKECLHKLSPFAREPVDCVLWVRADQVTANDYNPNVMAPSEKRLLLHSLIADGFTQPVVVSEDRGKYIVVDGFHRQLLGKKTSGAGKFLKGYLPVTCINDDRKGKAERIAATIRHNRARGKHQIASMSDIVRDLIRLGWSGEQIAQELGMDPDEVLRLKQISGLTELFDGEEFSRAWTLSDK